MLYSSPYVHGSFFESAALRRPLRNFGLISGFAASRVRSMLGATATLDAELHPRLARHKEYFEKHGGENIVTT